MSDVGESTWLRTPTEEIIAGVWQDILGKSVDRDSQFFEVGGDSLAAARVTNRLQRILGAALSLDLLFDSPVLARYAAVVDAQRRSAQGIPDDALPAVDRRGPLPLSALQENRLLREARNRQAGTPAAPMIVPFALQVAAPFDDEHLIAAVQRVVATHESLRTGFRLDLATGAATPFIADEAHCEVARSQAPPAERSAALRAAWEPVLAEPFPVARPPLMRASLVRFGPADAVVLVGVDHLVLDGWSVDLVVSAFARALAGAPGTEERPHQYVDWVAWQRRLLSGDTWERLVGHWRRRLAGTVPFPPLPLPRPATPVAAGQRREAGVDLPPAAVSALHRASRAAGTTMFMTVLSAVVAAWQRTTGTEDVIVHSPTANRSAPGAESIVGWLAHSVILRLCPPPAAEVPERLAHVRARVLEAFLHDDIPLPLLVKALQPDSHGRARRPARLFYAYEPPIPPPLRVAGGWLRRIAVDTDDPVAEPGLSFYAEEAASGGLSVRVVHDAGEVDAGFVEGLTASLSSTLDELVSYADSQGESHG